MKLFIFRLKEGSTADDALLELEEYLSDLYEIEDPLTGTVQIGGYSDKEEGLPREFTHVFLDQTSLVEEVDWQQQWSTYAPDFHHGLAHIDLSAYGGQTLQLKPGGGFGDFSHPTTRLVLELMAPHVKNKTVFDIGCGSGILAIAAVLLGAKHAFGIDILDEAIAHSSENAKINFIEEKTAFAKKIDPSQLSQEPCVIVMNMIENEQLAAWQSCKLLHSQKAYIVTSGILSSQKEQYLEWAQMQHWSLIDEKEKDGWAGFVFLQD